MSETYAPNQRNYSIGRGAVYLAILDVEAGTKGAFFHCGNLENVRLVPSQTKATLRSSIDASSGVLDSAVLFSDFTLEWASTEMNRRTLANGLQGTEAYYTQSSGTITAEELTDTVELGGVYWTANRQISSVTVKQGASTLVADTDYEVVDATSGAIHILPTSGTVTAGSTITVDYTAAAVAGTTQKIVQGGTQGTIDIAVKIITDPVRGPKREYHVWHLQLDAAEAHDIINGNDYARMPQKAVVINDAAGTFGGSTSDPYFRIYER